MKEVSKVKIYLLPSEFYDQLSKDIQAVNAKAVAAETCGNAMSVMGILQAGISDLAAKYRPLAKKQESWCLEHGRIYGFLRPGLFCKRPVQKRLALYLTYRVGEEFRIDLVQGGYTPETVPDGALFIDYHSADKEYGLYQR